MKCWVNPSGPLTWTRKQPASRCWPCWRDCRLPRGIVSALFRRKDGTIFPVLIEDRLLRNEEGKVVGIRATSRTSPNGRRRRRRCVSLQEQLRQSQKMEAVGRLAGGIAHDFNNLLTVIHGHCEISLLQFQGNNPLREDIVEIKKAADRAGNLTRQLLAFSRRQIMEMKVIDLNALLRELEKMLRRVMGEDVELVTVLDDHLGKIKMDPGQMEQVVLNLAINARDAMPSGGRSFSRRPMFVWTRSMPDPTSVLKRVTMSCSPSPTRDPGCLFRSRNGCSNLFLQPKRKARARDWVSQRFTGSSSRAAETSGCTVNPATGPPSGSICPVWIRRQTAFPAVMTPSPCCTETKRFSWWRTSLRSAGWPPVSCGTRDTKCWKRSTGARPCRLPASIRGGLISC